jgi:hypothetical protein
MHACVLSGPNLKNNGGVWQQQMDEEERIGCVCEWMQIFGALSAMLGASKVENGFFNQKIFLLLKFHFQFQIYRHK